MHYEEKAQTYKATLKQFTIVSEEEVLHEEKIIEASRSDPTQFRVLYEKYYRAVFLFIYHKVDGKELAADLTSQTFLKALQHINRYEFGYILDITENNAKVKTYRLVEKLRKKMS